MTSSKFRFSRRCNSNPITKTPRAICLNRWMVSGFACLKIPFSFLAGKAEDETLDFLGSIKNSCRKSEMGVG